MQKIAPFVDEFVQQQLAQDGKPHMVDLAVRPPWRLARGYFFRLGCLDGGPGYYFACLNAFSTVTAYARIKEMHALRSFDEASKSQQK